MLAGKRAKQVWLLTITAEHPGKDLFTVRYTKVALNNLIKIASQKITLTASIF